MKPYKLFFGRSPFALWARPTPKAMTAPRLKTLLPDKSVLWHIGRESGACSDHIEMSGFQVSAIVCYGRTGSGSLRLRRHITAPHLRKLPDDTRGSFSFDVSGGAAQFVLDGRVQHEKVVSACLRGKLTLQTQTPGLQVSRTLMPCADAPALVETVEVTAKTAGCLEVFVPFSTAALPAEKCANGKIFCGVAAAESGSVSMNRACDYRRRVALAAGRTHRFFIVYFACRQSEPVEIEAQLAQRAAFAEAGFAQPVLQTDSPQLDAAFSHCVLRSCESIFQTQSGLFHSPGGGSYYAALWTNDQCEYANPFFAYLSYPAAVESALNCYRQYEKYMDKSDRPFCEKTALVTSIVAEGRDFWNGAGDRGDGAMYAYGLCRFLLVRGDRRLAELFFDDIKWCIDFSLSRKNEHGVIASDSDELENRFPSGSANLNTSCLTYDALLNGALICDVLGKTDLAAAWRREAKALAENIENYFGAEVEGFSTYRYCAGEKNLRAWICMPLTVELFGRRDQTLAAVFSPNLYQNGLLRTTSAHFTTWDRSLLFALRGAFLAGDPAAFDRVCAYSRDRLLGNHSPYPFEAFPEGNRAHLSGESALFCRVVTEGLFGLRPVGWHKLRVWPKRDHISLCGLQIFGRMVDIFVKDGVITVKTPEKTLCVQADCAVFDFDSATAQAASAAV